MFDGLCRAGLVSEENAVDPKKIGWMRSCRTDKGVHAAGQVVSFKMLMKDSSDTDPQKVKEVIAELNKVMQDDMGIGPKLKIFGVIRTANSFHAKDRADSRFYEYLLPTYVFARQNREEFLKLAEVSSTRTDVDFRPGKAPKEAGNDESSEEELEDNEPAKPAYNPDRPALTEEELKGMYAYRSCPEDLERFNRILAYYCGTHNFHNLTIGKAPTDASAQRHIKSFLAGSPFLVSEDLKVGGEEAAADCTVPQLEWIAVRVHGVSFMLHQIRKMIGLAILAMRLDAYEPAHLDALFKRVFSKTEKFNVPKAPALGLFLDRPLFEGYNKKFQKEENREVLEVANFDDEIQVFKRDIIYPEIYGGEFRTHEFFNWLKCLDDHAYDFKYILN